MLGEIDIDKILDIAEQAGKATLEIYHQNFKVEEKNDKSPITEADKKSNEIIIEGLLRHYPKIPFISEETKHTAYDIRKNWKHFWLIDPLDGTKEFIKKNGEFTVNIALIEDQKSVLGVIYVPVDDVFYFAQKDRGSYKIYKGANREPIKASSKSTKEKLIVAGSRSHGWEALNTYLEKKKEEYKEVELLTVGSSLKFCMVAEGRADVYPRTGPTHEWDTAAGQAIVLESGKAVYEFGSEKPLIYNKKELLNGWFIAQ